ncbi:MAG: CCA tRNA nucleotidyltransferase [Paracoccaceae bacterium]
MTRINGRWLENPATQRVMTLLTDAGYQAYFVGGCVRNALLKTAISDVDIATDAHPDRVIELSDHAGLKAIPTGVEHGTVTVMSAGILHEITTYRKDIATDGRRAVVAFSGNITDDARRRDFTMNALYADAAGQVVDPLGGMDDLENGRVRFIENADTRIKEDYLRSLRFFRFCAWYGDPQAGLDPDALAGISANLEGLEALSKERVGAEFKKLLAAPNPAPAVAAMDNTGVLTRLLPGATSQYLAPLIHLEADDPNDPIRRLAALGGTGVQNGLRLSRADNKRLSVLREILATDMHGMAAGYRFGARAAIDGELLFSAMLGQQPPNGFRERAEKGNAQIFPICADDLMPELQGKALGLRLKELELRWIASDFSLTKTQLLT